MSQAEREAEANGVARLVLDARADDPHLGGAKGLHGAGGATQRSRGFGGACDIRPTPSWSLARTRLTCGDRAWGWDRTRPGLVLPERSPLLSPFPSSRGTGSR